MNGESYLFVSTGIGRKHECKNSKYVTVVMHAWKSGRGLREGLVALTFCHGGVRPRKCLICVCVQRLCTLEDWEKLSGQTNPGFLFFFFCLKQSRDAVFLAHVGALVST